MEYYIPVNDYTNLNTNNTNTNPNSNLRPNPPNPNPYVNIEESKESINEEITNKFDGVEWDQVHIYILSLL